MNYQEFVNLAQFGVAGLAVYLFYRLTANHINHQTKVLEELRDAIRELKEIIKSHLFKQ